MNRAPPGWLPRLHNTLFDADYLGRLLETAGFRAAVYDYPYPREIPRLCLGFISRHRTDTEAGPANGGTDAEDLLPPSEVVRLLREVPGVDRFVDVETI